MSRTLFEDIQKAMAICMPETFEESQMSCDECPICEQCKSEEAVMIPTALAIKIKQYFSNNWGKKFIQ